MQIEIVSSGVKFDYQKMAAAAKRSKRKGTIKGLAFVRTKARSSIRRSKKSSEPGSPPRAHAKGFASIKSIFFIYEESTDTGIVGPVKLNAKKTGVLPSGTTVPGVLEHGGHVEIRETFIKGKWVKARPGKLPGTKNRKRRARIKPREFMLPAMIHEVEAGNVAQSYQGTFTDS